MGYLIIFAGIEFREERGKYVCMYVRLLMEWDNKCI